MSANLDLFNEAISLHQNKKNDEALAVYLKILDKSHDATNLTSEQASTVSQNIAVIYMQQGNTNLAYVYNKKALTLNPQNSFADKFHSTHLKNYKVAEIARDISVTEQLNNLGLKYVPYEATAVLSIVLFLVVLKMLFAFLLARKKTLIENLNPVFLNWKFYLYAVVFLFSVTLFMFKNIELNQNTGIIKAATTSVMTAAGTNQAIITEVNIGHVVQILQTKEIDGVAYAQIKVPGAFSGWIKKADLETLNSAN